MLIFSYIQSRPNRKTIKYGTMSIKKTLCFCTNMPICDAAYRKGGLCSRMFFKAKLKTGGKNTDNNKNFQQYFIFNSWLRWWKKIVFSESIWGMKFGCTWWEVTNFMCIINLVLCTNVQLVLQEVESKSWNVTEI